MMAEYEANIIDEDGAIRGVAKVTIDDGRMNIDYSEVAKLPAGRYMVEPIKDIPITGTFDVEAETREAVFESLLEEYANPTDVVGGPSVASWRKRWRDARDDG